MDISIILDRGAKYLGNHPDDLCKRIALAHVLVDARQVRSVEAGILAFRIWALPEAREREIPEIFAYANERSKSRE